MPYQNFVGEYVVYTIKPKIDKNPIVFESEVAAINQGGYAARGGARQSMVPNLSDWEKPEKIDTAKAY